MVRLPAARNMRRFSAALRQRQDEDETVSAQQEGRKAHRWTYAGSATAFAYGSQRFVIHSRGF
jgi:hypothetical protein